MRVVIIGRLSPCGTAGKFLNGFSILVENLLGFPFSIHCLQIQHGWFREMYITRYLPSMVPFSQVAHAVSLEVPEQHLRLLPCAHLPPTNRRLRCRAPHHLFRYACRPLLLLGIFGLLFFVSLFLVMRLLCFFIPASTTWVMSGQFCPG
jgi:hypothetical protein